MKIELYPQVESAIYKTLPDRQLFQSSWINGLIDYAVLCVNIGKPRPEYSEVEMKQLGSAVVDDILTHAEPNPIVPYHGKNRELVREYVMDARTGMGRLIDDLDIPNGAKRYIRGSLDQVDIRYVESGESGAIHYWFGGKIIYINIPKIFHHAHEISESFGEARIPRPLFKGLVYYLIGHELGHTIHFLLGKKWGGWPPVQSIKKLQDGYPLSIRTEGSFDEMRAEDFLRFIVCERFAQFFGWELVRGFGISDTIRRDYIRSGFQDIFGNGFSFSQMDQFVGGYQDRLSDIFEIKSMPHEEYKSVEKCITDTLIVYSVSNLNTFPRATVEKLIRNEWEWKKRKLARHQKVV